ncbi:MAG: hypothetical protein FWD27_07630 [Coriobacteriia bacterium]|nr:hypothetical protein [Coriobacteriia bacterium]
MKSLKGIGNKLLVVVLAATLGIFAGSSVANAHGYLGAARNVNLDGRTWSHQAYIFTHPNQYFYSATYAGPTNSSVGLNWVGANASLFYNTNGALHSYSGVYWNSHSLSPSLRWTVAYTIWVPAGTALCGWGDARYWSTGTGKYWLFDCWATGRLASHY